MIAIPALTTRRPPVKPTVNATSATRKPIRPPNASSPIGTKASRAATHIRRRDEDAESRRARKAGGRRVQDRTTAPSRRDGGSLQLHSPWRKATRWGDPFAACADRDRIARTKANEGTLPSRRRSVTISWEGVCRTVTVLTTVEAFDAVLFDPASTCERFVTISETRPKSHPGLRLAQAGDRQRGCARFEMHASVTRAVLVAFLGGPSIACPIELAWSSEGRPAARRFQVTSRQHRASGHRR